MAGPPVEVQVRVNTGGSVTGSVFNWKVISPGIVTWPVEGRNINICRQASLLPFTIQSTRCCTLFTVKCRL